MNEYPKTVDVSLPCPSCEGAVEFQVFYLDPECLTAPLTMTCPHCEADIVNCDEKRLRLYDED